MKKRNLNKKKKEDEEEEGVKMNTLVKLSPQFEV